MRKSLFFLSLRIASVCVFAALLVFTVFISESRAQTVYEFNTARVEYRETHDGSGDHSRVGFTLKVAGPPGPTVFPPIDVRASEMWYQNELAGNPIQIGLFDFWAGQYDVAYGVFNDATGQWEYDPIVRESYYRYKLDIRDDNNNPYPIARPGTYTFTIYIENGQKLAKEMYFKEDWQPRPIITDIWFDTDGNLHVQNDWTRDGPVKEFSPGSQFVTSIWNANETKFIGSYMPTTMTHTFIPAATLAQISFVGTQEFTIQMYARTGDGTTRVYGQKQFIVPEFIPIRDGSSEKSLCEIPIPGEGAGVDVFYDRRNFDPIMTSEPTGGIKIGAYIGNYPDVETRDLVASKTQQVVFENTTSGNSYQMTAPELYKWKESFSGEYSLFAGHPGMVIGDWLVKIMYDSQWYEATFKITPQMLEQTPPLPVPRVRVKWQNRFNPCDNGIKIIAPATNGEQYRLRIFDEDDNLVDETNMTVINFFGKEFIVHRYNRADVLGKRARIETRHYDTAWLSLISWSTWPPSCNARGLFPGNMARAVTWFEIPPARDPSCEGGMPTPLE